MNGKVPGKKAMVRKRHKRRFKKYNKRLGEKKGNVGIEDRSASKTSLYVPKSRGSNVAKKFLT